MASENKPTTGGGAASSSCCDLDLARERMDGADDLLVEVIAVFLEDYPNSLQELRRSAAAGVAADLQRSAHTIKGAVGNFVAGPATEVAFQIEQFAKQGAMPQAVSLVDSLESEVLRLAAALSAYRDRREAA